MAVIFTLLKHDIRVAFRSASSSLYPLLFFVMSTSLFPLAIGPESALLQQTASGVLWVMALLAVLLPLHQLFDDDYHDGTLEQLRVSGALPAIIVLARVASYWLVTVFPLVLISPLLALMLTLDTASIPRLVVSLLCGTPTLCFINAMAAALMLGARKGAGLVFLLSLPLTIPVLIFGTLAVEPSHHGQTAFIALSALLLIMAPISVTLCTAALQQK